MKPLDHYVAQRLALATYKSNLPTPAEALQEAAAILESLGPATSTDPETLGLYGAVHKRFWDSTGAASHLDQAIWALEKGFYVRNDSYNGINLAYLLNVRSALQKEPAERIADFVIARRTRLRVLALCEKLLASDPAPGGTDAYWIRATMAEAYAGLGEEAKAQELLDDAKAQAGAAGWMVQSTVQQLAKLKDLLAQSPLARTASNQAP